MVRQFDGIPWLSWCWVTSACYSYIFPIIAYGFIGLEMTAITAFEARDLHSLRRSSQFLAYVIFGIYMFCIIGELLVMLFSASYWHLCGGLQNLRAQNVEWSNPGLPLISGDPSRNSTGTGKIYKTDSILIIAALNAGYKKFPGLLSGFLIFAALSSANSALYVASRSLYGMTRTVNPWKWFRWLRVLGSVWYRTGVPMWALLFSAMAFIWLPFLKIHGGDKTTHVSQPLYLGRSIVNVQIAYPDYDHNLQRKLSNRLGFALFSLHTLSCLVSQSWSSHISCFWRIICNQRIKKHREEVARVYPEYDRWSDSSQASTFLAGLQPLPAWVGLVGCLGTIFVCTTATWWSTHATAQKVAVAYGAVGLKLPTFVYTGFFWPQSSKLEKPIILAILFVVLKLITRRLPVRLDDDSNRLLSTLEHLRYLKPERRSRWLGYQYLSSIRAVSDFRNRIWNTTVDRKTVPIRE